MSDLSHKDVLQFVQKKSEPFATTEDVAEQFQSVTRKTVRKRLNDLAEQDELSCRQIGPSAKVWYHTESEESGDSSRSPESLSQ